MSTIIQRLLAMAEAEIDLGPDQTLFRTGDSVKSLYIVLDGSVRLARHQANGAIVVLQRAHPQQLLAEASLFATRYHCDGTSEHGARVSRISKSKILQAHRDDAGWWAELAANLAGEVQRARARAEMLSLRTVSERLGAWLALHGELPARGQWINVAQEIGVSPEALYRELARRAADEKRR